MSRRKIGNLPLAKKPSRKKIKSARQRLEKECDALWQECIKAKAGYRCQLTDIKYDAKQLVGHHFITRGVYRLRWNLDNGICLKKNLHYPLAHLAASEFAVWAVEKFGREWYDKLLLIRHASTEPKIDLQLTKIYLAQELSRILGASQNEQCHV